MPLHVPSSPPLATACGTSLSKLNPPLPPAASEQRGFNCLTVHLKYVKKAGIRKKVRVHTLRHTFGAHKADKHMGIATLQELMGHKKKETTLKYIHLAKTNLRQEMMQTAL
jgi:site-specific recombinase XerD